MSGINLFTADTQSTVSITTATSTARVALTVKANDTTLRVYNSDTSNVSFINVGDSTVTATLPSGATPGSIPIGPGQTCGFSLPLGSTHVAAICSAGTPVVYLTPGNGV